jgi:hypothetical protein
MKLTWEVDDATAVEAELGALGKEIIRVNGKEVHNGRRMSGRRDIDFYLSDGRTAQLSVHPQLIGQPIALLRVQGRPLAASGKKPETCGKCGAEVRPNDRFCDRCGNALPTFEDRAHEKQVKNATGAIKVLAALFAVFGVALFFISRAEAEKALSSLQGMAPDELFPVPVEGVTYTVGELRDQILWEPWGILITNLVLAAVMTGLAIWGRRAPLPAILVATATYLVVIVTNTIVDPTTIGQGIIMKIIIIAFLAKGIKAALALRRPDARA